MWSQLMSKKKPYFPNNWKKLKDVPEELFENIDFEDFMDWKIGGYEIPSSVSCIIREQNLKTGKVKEHVYQRSSAAQRKIKELMEAGESEFVVCDEDNVHHLYPKYLDEED